MDILVESIAGFERACQEGYDRSARWHSSAPMVIEHLKDQGYAVTWLDDQLQSGVPDRIGYAALAVVGKLTPFFEEMGRRNDIDEPLHFVAMPLQRFLCAVMYKQAVFHAWRTKQEGPHLVVGDPNISPPSRGHIGVDAFDTLFAVLARHPGNPSTRVLDMDLGDRSGLYNLIDKVTFWDRALSLADVSASQVLSRIMRFLFRRRSLGFGRWPLVHILRENELIREALLSLMVSRVAVAFENPLETILQEGPPLEGLPGEQDIQNALKGAAGANGVPGDFTPVGAIAFERLQRASFWWKSYSVAARERVAGWVSDPMPHLLVSNTISGPAETALAVTCRKAGVPVVVAEHGVSAGLSVFHKPLRPFTEAALCDVYLACSQNAVQFYDEEVTLRGRSVAVGIARQVRRVPLRWVQRAVTRRRLRAGKGNRVVIYVTTVCQNNRRFLPHSPEDRDVHAVERIMVEQVMPYVRGVPVVKFYNTRRHWDPHPFAGPFRPKHPVRVLQAGDFRFLRAGSDIIILQIPLSTLGWAFGTGKPIFYLEQPGMDLLPQVKSALQQSVFLFSTLEPRWWESLLEMLNRTDEEIESGWRAKRKAREEFLRDCVNGPERAGHRSAHVLKDTALRFSRARAGRS
jgi:hypothetical protein